MPSACRRVVFGLLLAFGGSGPAWAWTSPAPDVVVYCLPSLAPVITRLGAQFRHEGGAEVHVFVGPDGRLFGLIAHRARADVVVGGDALMQTLRTHKLLKPPAPVMLGLDPYVVVAKPGLAAGSAQALVAAHRTVVTDPTAAAGFDGVALLRRIDQGAAAQARPIGVENAQRVVATVAQGADLVGIARASDAAASAGLVRVAAVVDAPPLRVEAALTENGQSGNSAAFLAFIAAARPAWRAAGLEAGQ
jgi:ABC-type molybdate transport system substrate-binding protein